MELQEIEFGILNIKMYPGFLGENLCWFNAVWRAICLLEKSLLTKNVNSNLMKAINDFNINGKLPNEILNDILIKNNIRRGETNYPDVAWNYFANMLNEYCSMELTTPKLNEKNKLSIIPIDYLYNTLFNEGETKLTEFNLLLCIDGDTLSFYLHFGNVIYQKFGVIYGSGHIILGIPQNSEEPLTMLKYSCDNTVGNSQNIPNAQFSIYVRIQ